MAKQTSVFFLPEAAILLLFYLILSPVSGCLGPGNCPGNIADLGGLSGPSGLSGPLSLDGFGGLSDPRGLSGPLSLDGFGGLSGAASSNGLYVSGSEAGPPCDLVFSSGGLVSPASDLHGL